MLINCEQFVSVGGVQFSRLFYLLKVTVDVSEVVESL